MWQQLFIFLGGGGGGGEMGVGEDVESGTMRVKCFVFRRVQPSDLLGFKARLLDQNTSA